ncbi:Dabb family protein [Acetobacter cerevisiae]|uniref:Stress responsive protein n=1 Tax=Acetobacter cerevisiae TaxID=178900 RepID=A0A149VD60_9PROT|nr:Dabb family protein [Acetobacter cerevisiae]KXV77853.1 stress responsive protein [Acetobacter cerevisiae]
MSRPASLKTLLLACAPAALALGLAGPALSAPTAKTAPATTPALDAAARAVRAELKSVGATRFTAPDYKPGVVRHMVMFTFRPGTTAAQRAEVTRRFVALTTLSRRPDGKTVVTSIETGAQSSGENADLGLEQGYLVTFQSEGDRNFYVGRPIVTEAGCFDPAHDTFKTFAGPYLAKVVVFDFTPTAPAAP